MNTIYIIAAGHEAIVFRTIGKSVWQRGLMEFLSLRWAKGH